MVISIVDVAGVGPSTAALLAEHGISSAESLAETPHDRLVSIPGVGAVRARRLSEAAARAVGDAPGKEERGDKNDEKKKQKDKKGKDKKRKDKKRKDKKVKKSEGKDAKANKAKHKRRKQRKRRKSKE